MRKLSMPFAPTYFGKWERKFRVFNYYISDSQFDNHWCIHTVTKILVTSVSLSIVLLRNDKKALVVWNSPSQTLVPAMDPVLLARPPVPCLIQQGGLRLKKRQLLSDWQSAWQLPACVEDVERMSWPGKSFPGRKQGTPEIEMTQD